MSSYKDIKITDFTYDLPDLKIAKYPLPQRDKSKLLIWKNGVIDEDVFENCIDYLPENAQLVFNNTRVIHARLFFRKETGAKIEVFCLEPIDPADYQIAFQQTEEITWKCMVGNSKKWKDGFLNHSFEINGKKLRSQQQNYLRKEIHFIFVLSGMADCIFLRLLNISDSYPFHPI